MIKNYFLFYRKHYQKNTRMIFSIGLLIGILSYLYFFYTPEAAEYMFKEMTYAMEQKGYDGNRSAWWTFTSILWNNVKLGLVMILLGLVPLVILPTFTSFASFFALGLVLAIFESKLHKAFELFVFGLLPHTVIEFFGFAIAGGIGVSLRLTICQKFFSKKRKTIHVWRAMKNAGKGYLLYVVPLLVLGSIIECTFSSWLAYHFLHLT